MTLHWDGNTPLFVTDSSGAIKEIKIEGLGYYAPAATNPMTFLDRDPSGFVVAAHWSGGHSDWQASNPYHQICNTQALSGYEFFEPSSDGISDGENTIQGVRNFDPALATWTSPDAYAGDASDPMSRKSYMWNRNNSYAYSDPTGFDAAFLFADYHGAFVHLWIEIEHDNGTVTKYSFGPSSNSKPVGRPLVNRPGYDNEHRYGAGVAAQTILGVGQGVLTKKNGGFDEAAAAKAAQRIQNMKLPYGLFTSNSVAKAICSAGGGSSEACNLEGWKAAGLPISLPAATPAPQATPQ